MMFTDRIYQEISNGIRRAYSINKTESHTLCAVHHRNLTHHLYTLIKSVEEED